jgi:hypothetical protein
MSQSTKEFNLRKRRRPSVGIIASSLICLATPAIGVSHTYVCSRLDQRLADAAVLWFRPPLDAPLNTVARWEKQINYVIDFDGVSPETPLAKFTEDQMERLTKFVGRQATKVAPDNNDLNFGIRVTRNIKETAKHMTPLYDQSVILTAPTITPEQVITVRNQILAPMYSDSSKCHATFFFNGEHNFFYSIVLIDANAGYMCAFLALNEALGVLNASSVHAYTGDATDAQKHERVMRAIDLLYAEFIKPGMNFKQVKAALESYCAIYR